MDKAFAVVRLVAIALAIVTAFATVPYAAAILLVLGMIGSIATKPEDAMRIYAVAIVLSIVPKALDAIPEAGTYLNAIFASLGLVFAGLAVGNVVKGAYNRVKGDWIK